MPPLRIVLPTYNRRAVLERTLPAYLAMPHPLLVVDDGSQDGTAAWLRGLGVAVVVHPRRLGLTAARNTGLELAGTTWVLFGEDDVLMPADHGERLLAEAERLGRGAPAPGAVAGRLYAGVSWTLPAAPPDDGPAALLDARWLLGDFAAPLMAARPLPSLHACALVRRAAALAIGGYDRAFRDSAFREESDFYARLWHAGHPCWLTPATWAVHVRHRLGGGCRGDRRLAAKLANRWSYWRNNARFVDRHRRLWQRWDAQAGLGSPKGRWAGRIALRALQAWRAP
jgi:glycosyltransferase involved in cell wall biosynthesis